MRHCLASVVPLAALCFAIAPAGERQSNSPSTFRSAQAVSASRVVIPWNSIANGMVLLEAHIDAAGKLQSVEVVRGIASLTDVSVHAVQSWGFSAATLDGKPVASRLAVALVFCPAGGFLYDAKIPLSPNHSDPQNTKSRNALPPDPPEIVEAEYASSGAVIVGGAVVLNVTVGPQGRVAPENVKTILDTPGLTYRSTEALKTWKFAPARLDGEPIQSSIVIVFAFRPPVSN